MKFSLEDFREDILFGDGIVEDEIVDQGRWTTLHRIVFTYESKLWEAHYQVPSTENSGGFDDVNYDGIDAYEVESYEVTVKKYRRI